MTAVLLLALLKLWELLRQWYQSCLMDLKDFQPQDWFHRLSEMSVAYSHPNFLLWDLTELLRRRHQSCLMDLWDSLHQGLYRRLSEVSAPCSRHLELSLLHQRLGHRQL